MVNHLFLKRQAAILIVTACAARELSQALPHYVPANASARASTGPALRLLLGLPVPEMIHLR